MTVEENLMLGGYTLPMATASEATEQVFAKYARLAKRRHQKAGALSGGERRLLELSRALVSSPSVLLVMNRPIGLEPRYIDMVFEILADLRESEGKPLSWWNKTPKKDWPLPTSAMC